MIKEIIKKHRDYLKDNPKGYWFKRKLYGYGWTPVRWQGWVVIGIYIALIVGLSLQVENITTLREVLVYFIFPVVVLTSILIYIAYKKGEKPRWQWGIEDKDLQK